MEDWRCPSLTLRAHPPVDCDPFGRFGGNGLHRGAGLRGSRCRLCGNSAVANGAQPFSCWRPGAARVPGNHSTKKAVKVLRCLTGGFVQQLAPTRVSDMRCACARTLFRQFACARDAKQARGAVCTDAGSSFEELHGRWLGGQNRCRYINSGQPRQRCCRRARASIRRPPRAAVLLRHRPTAAK